MKIGEVARAANVTASRIRFYEAEGLLPPAERTDNGYRTYPAATVGVIVFIERAQQLGFSLGEIRATLPDADGQPPECERLIEALRRKLGAVEAHIAASQALKGEILHMIDLLASGEAHLNPSLAYQRTAVGEAGRVLPLQLD